MLEKKYQIHLQNHYDATSRQVQKKEIKVLKKHNNLLNGEVFPYQICLESTMEYSRFMLWFEKEVQKIVKELWNQHFIIKLTLSQLHFR
ncbi:carbamoyl-phosphate synthase, partial [Listeria monocytogenes]|nr:carbamoyl-phosphate synthase [Listeria monocytogenes]